MADSVDRVFGHALNTVNKIRPGSQKPPAADRLRLYGLYKQAMEGDVDLIADRPASRASPEALKKEQEKYDAWNANHGIGRTEAKRRYIGTLVETMHKYASHTDEAKELVEELEFVWDQIKSQSLGSSGSEHSSPLQNLERSSYLINGSGEGAAVGSSAAAFEGAGAGAGRGGKEMRLLPPVSQRDEEEEREEFVDAPVSQTDYGEPGTMDEAAAAPDGKVSRPQPRREGTQAPDMRWRRRMEAALVKMTAEVAALREQLESRRFFKDRRQHSLLGWILRFSWFCFKLVVADVFILWIVILYMRRKKDRRLEGAVRVLLGDAVAEVRRVGREMKVQVPKLPSRKSL